MRHYLPSFHLIIAVLLVVSADKYFNLTDQLITKIRGY